MKRILLVDDDLSTTSVLEMLLTQEGFEAASVNDSRQALPFAFRFEPDLILLDLMMPMMDGIETCKMIRMTARFKKTPIFFFTAIGDLDYKNAAYDAGATDFIVKPIHPAEFLAKIKTAIGEGK